MSTEATLEGQAEGMTDVVCTRCGYVGEPTAITKGSLGIELILWLCLLIPGLIYSIWRLSSRQDGCPSCGGTALIPRTSPMAQKFLRENLPEKLVARAPASSGTAYSAGRSLGRFVRRMVK